MRKHINTYLFSPLWWVLSLLLVIMFLLVLLFLTPLGTQIIATAANSSLDPLTIKGMRGTLLSGLQIDEVIWDDGDSFSVKDVDLKIRHFDTNRGRLVAEMVKAGRLTINLTGPSSGKEVTSLPNFGLPLNLNAHIVQLDSLQITKGIPDDPGSNTLLFQIRDMQLQKVTINEERLRFRRLQGSPIIMDRPLKINVTEGNLNMNQPHDLMTSGNISFDHPDIGKFDGNVDLSGTLTDYSFAGDIKHQHEILGKQVIKLQGEGNYRYVDLSKIHLDGEHGAADAQGWVEWDPAVRWDFRLKSDNLSTKKFLPDWPAEVSTDIKYTGSLVDGVLENEANILSLDGNLQGIPLSIKGGITEREGLIRAKQTEVTLGDNIIKLKGAVSEPFNLEWSIDAPNLDQISPNLISALKLENLSNIGGGIEGSGTLKGNTFNPEVKAKVITRNLVYGDIKQGKEAITLDVNMGVDKKNVILKELIVKSGKNQIKATGQASEPFDLNLEVKVVDLKQLSPDLAGKITGSGSLKGSVEAPKANLNLTASSLDVAGFKQGKDVLNLQGDVAVNTVAEKQVILLKDLSLKSGSNAINISGQASEPMNIAFKVDAPDVKQVSPDMLGRVKGEGIVVGDYKSPTIKTSINASNLGFKEFLLAKSALNAKAEVQILDGIPIIKDLALQSGKNNIKISGRASSPFDLSWDIDSQNLGELMSGLSGNLVAKGNLKGDIEKPIINTSGSASNIRFQDFKLGAAKFNAKTQNGIYQVKADLSKLESADQKVNNAEFNLNGKVESHVINLSFDHELAKVTTKANGGWIDQSWKGFVQTLNFNGEKVGDWRLQKPTQVSVSEKGFTSTQVCLVNKKTQACSTASWSELAGLKAKGKLNKTPLALFKPFLPEGVVLSGSVSGSFDIQQNNGNPNGYVKLQLPDSNFSFKDETGEEQIFAYESAVVDATIDDKTIKVKAAMGIVNRGKLTSDAVIKLSPQNGKHTIKGSAQFDIPNIYWAQDFVPHSRGLRGELKSKVAFSGLLSQPRITGTANLKDAYLRLPEAGTEITNININLKADKPGQALISGKMNMGKGLVNVSGNVDTRDIKNWKASAKISAKDIQFMNTNEIKATMTPDIVLQITPKAVEITGKIIIPQADINLKEVPETSIDESEDAIVIGEVKPDEKQDAIKIRPNVLVQLGDKVTLNAFDLRAKLTGSVNVTHNNRDILTNGSLRVSDGKYKAYGQDLEIDNGRLIFNGSPKLIGMDIRATRTIDKDVVGVHLGGTVLSPKSKIFSDPVKTDSEALSYLITGHSLTTASGRESALLMSAVRGLGITGNDSLIQNIGSSLGLDDVNIVSGEDIKQSKLQLGKRLGSNLYVRYLVGLFDQAQKVVVEYRINDVLSLEAETTIDNYALDFIYEIERD